MQQSKSANQKSRKEFLEAARQMCLIIWLLAGLSVQSPLKAALTGLELLLARAQIWEESAAKHVSLGAELEGVAALATRWRRLELAAWRNLLNTTRSSHAAGQLSVLLLCHCCTERALTVVQMLVLTACIKCLHVVSQC